MIPRSDVAKIIYNIFTHERFDADLKARKARKWKKKAVDLIKEDSSENLTVATNTETDSSTESDNTSSVSASSDYTLTHLKSVHTCNFAKCINTYIL